MVERYSLSNGRQFRCIEFMPSVSPAGSAVLYLHGAGERRTDIELVKRRGLPARLARGMATVNSTVICPQLEADHEWEPQRVAAFISSLRERYACIALGGYSLGGIGVCEVIARFNANPSWGLAAEHGELAAVQWSQFLEAAVAALPLAIALRLAPRKVGLLVVLLSSLSVALLYVVQPTHQFSSNDSWLANFTWQVAGIGVALAPMLLAGLIEALVWLCRAASQNVA